MKRMLKDADGKNLCEGTLYCHNELNTIYYIKYTQFSCVVHVLETGDRFLSHTLDGTQWELHQLVFD